MKRFVSILLVAMLIVSAFATTAFAAGSGSVSASKDVAAKAGETVSVTVTVSGDFANFEMYVKVDSPLEITGFSGSGLVGNTGTGKVVWAEGENVKGYSFVVKVKVPDGTKAGTYPVNLSVDFVSDQNLSDLVISVYNGSIVVSCDHDYKLEKTVGATCTEDGYDEYKCTKCGHTYKKTIPAGHKWDNGTVTEKATCTKDGVMTYKCSVCGATKTESIPATGHSYKTEWSYDETHHWHACEVCGVKADEAEHTLHEEIQKEPSATEEGLMLIQCDTCDYAKEKVLPKDDIDPVPPTGDITGHIAFGSAAILAVLAALAYVVMKRKAIK